MPRRHMSVDVSLFCSLGMSTDAVLAAVLLSPPLPVTSLTGMKKFWSTKDPGQKAFAFNVGVGQVIKGWDEGFMTMKLGEEARLEMTGDYAYGSGGFPAWGIPPNATLIFDVAILKIE